jgi:hypothetical protein
LDAFLAVMEARHVGSAVLKLGEGIEIRVAFVPPMPVAIGADPTPGGWKSPQHLDDVSMLRDEKDLPQ